MVLDLFWQTLKVLEVQCSCTWCTRILYIVRALYIQCMTLVHAMREHCSCSVWALFTQCMSIVHTVCEPCSRRARALYVQCVNLVPAVREPCTCSAWALYMQCVNLVPAVREPCTCSAWALYLQCVSLVHVVLPSILFILQSEHSLKSDNFYLTVLYIIGRNEIIK